MKIRHFLYNSFLIEDEGVKIAIDPGQNLWIWNLSSLIPKEEWKTITHVLVTHGDPDHYWQADRLAITANAPLIMNSTMIQENDSETSILIPRKDAVKFIPFSGKAVPLRVGKTIDIDGVKIQGVLTKHGPIKYSVLGIKKYRIPGPNERVGFGAIGYYIKVNNKTILNLGDSLLHKEWSNLKPDILMLPIGGLGNNVWTMDITDALEAVKLVSPKQVIPCHYNVPFLWKKIFAPADDQKFKREVEKMGLVCNIMHCNDAIEV